MCAGSEASARAARSLWSPSLIALAQRWSPEGSGEADKLEVSMEPPSIGRVSLLSIRPVTLGTALELPFSVTSALASKITARGPAWRKNSEASFG